MTQWLFRVGLSQAVAWVSFGLAILLVGLPLWIPSPVTIAALTLLKSK